MPLRTFTFTFVALLAFGLAPRAGAQLLAPPTRVETAEVRGLDVIPGDLAKGFDEATPSSTFAANVKAIFVRFQASKPPVIAGLVVSWAVAADSGEMLSLQRTPVDAAALTSGAIDVFSNGGKPLALGRYVVSLVGPDGKVYRTVEFRVGPPSPRTASAAPMTRLEKVYFDQYSLTYPYTFLPQPVVVGMTGVFLRRTAPFGLMFSVLSDPEHDTVVPQARFIVQLMLRRVQSGSWRVTNTVATDVPQSQLGPGMIAGKILELTLTHGMKAQVGLYSKMIDGRRVLFGYAVLTGKGIPEEYVPLLTSDPNALIADFFRMMDSFKGGTPWGAKTPGERRP